MKKIPTLFEREFANHRVVGISDKIHPGMEWVLAGEGIATEKFDGACCAMMNGFFYRRYDAKRGKKPPEGAIPCCEADPITGHHPHWLRVDPQKPDDRWFVEAVNNYLADGNDVEAGYGRAFTYEACGPHFQNNPRHLRPDTLIPHGVKSIPVERSFDGIREYLREHAIEGIVFWKDGEPQCKIKRSDFGFEWPVKLQEVE